MTEIKLEKIPDIEKYLFIYLWHFYFFAPEVHFIKTQLGTWTSYSCTSRLCNKSTAKKQPTSEQSYPNISEDESSDESSGQSNIFEKVTAKRIS